MGLYNISKEDWDIIASIATIIGSIITSIGVILIYIQVRDAKRFSRAEFTNALDTESKSYTAIGRRFWPGGDLYNVENYDLSAGEKADLLEYLGFFEKVYLLYKQAAIKPKTIYVLMGGRFKFIMNSNIVKTLIDKPEFQAHYRPIFKLKKLIERYYLEEEVKFLKEEKDEVMDEKA